MMYRLYSTTSSYISYIICTFFSTTDTTTPHLFTLSLHDALPISFQPVRMSFVRAGESPDVRLSSRGGAWIVDTVVFRSEEHTSELQSLTNLVCRLLLEKKKIKGQRNTV